MATTSSASAGRKSIPRALRAPDVGGYWFALHRSLSAFSFRSASRARSSHALAILSKVSRSFASIDCAMRIQSAAYSRYVFASFIVSASSGPSTEDKRTMAWPCSARSHDRDNGVWGTKYRLEKLGKKYSGPRLWRQPTNITRTSSSASRSPPRNYTPGTGPVYFKWRKHGAIWPKSWKPARITPPQNNPAAKPAPSGVRGTKLG